MKKFLFCTDCNIVIEEGRLNHALMHIEYYSIKKTVQAIISANCPRCKKSIIIYVEEL